MTCRSVAVPPWASRTDEMWTRSASMSIHERSRRSASSLRSSESDSTLSVVESMATASRNVYNGRSVGIEMSGRSSATAWPGRAESSRRSSAKERLVRIASLIFRPSLQVCSSRKRRNCADSEATVDWVESAAIMMSMRRRSSSWPGRKKSSPVSASIVGNRTSSSRSSACCRAESRCSQKALHERP